jgi:hypothetical protein
VNGKFPRDFCQQLHGLSSELASAQQAEKLDARIADINGTLGKSRSTSAMTEADPQAAVLTKLANMVFPSMKVEDMQTALTIFVAVLLEIGSGFGMYVAFSTWRLYERAVPAIPQRASVAELHVAPQVVPVAPVRQRLGANDNRSAPKLQAPETDVERFYKERIDASEGASLTATTLYEDYCAWCEEQQKEPLALPTFGREFGELGVQKAKIAGRVRYIGIGLRSGMDAEEDKKQPERVAAAA